MKDCLQVLSFDPDNEKALFRRAKIHERQGELDLAYRDILDGLLRHPQSSSLLALKNTFAKENYYLGKY